MHRSFGFALNLLAPYLLSFAHNVALFRTHLHPTFSIAAKSLLGCRRKCKPPFTHGLRRWCSVQRRPSELPPAGAMRLRFY
jgi:hypothetical protein